MKKNIHVIVKYFYPVAAGIETNILETYSVLVKKGWNVTIHTSLDTLTEKNCLKENEIIRGITVRRYAFGIFGFSPVINWNEKQMIALHNFNVFPHFFIMLRASFENLLGVRRYRLILTPHGGFNPEWSVFPRFTGFLKRLYHFTVGTTLINWGVDLIRAVSDWEGDEIKKKGISKEKVIIISNGVEKEAYEDVDKKVSLDTKKTVDVYGDYILQVGRVYPIKNYETTIKALPMINEKIKFVIMGPLDYVNGKTMYKDYLLTLAKSLKVEDRVIFAGVHRGIDKYYIIKHAQMMVHMAIWESFCNVVHEGLSQGLVCIVANNTALPYLIKNDINGYCVETKDASALADRINYVLINKDSSLVKSMMKRNKIYGLENSWQSIAEKVSNNYAKLLAK